MPAGFWTTSVTPKKERDERLRSHQPGTGETAKTYPTITDAELEAAIALADEAHRGWSKSTTVAERAALVRRVGELHTERRDQLAAIIVREMGKPTDQGLDETATAPTSTPTTPTTRRSDEGRAVNLLAGEGLALIRRDSLGVLLGIMPWNFPYYQIARFAGPNLVIGNTILLKHAPQCPESAEALQQMYNDAGFPRVPTSTSMPPTTRSPVSSPTRACRESR